MKIHLIAILIAGLWSVMPKVYTYISLPLHISCQNMVTEKTKYLNLVQSLICGVPLYNFELYPAYVELGLIHLFVVSGFHLQLLVFVIKKIFREKFKFRDHLIICLSFFYSLVCNLNPPVTRVAIYFLFKKLAAPKENLLLPSIFQFFVGLSCLVVFPKWWNSYSFLLSWAASLAVSVPAKNNLMKCFNVYLIMTPFLFNFNFVHPISVLANFFLSPLFSFILFPLSLMLVVFPPLADLHDYIWSQFNQLCVAIAAEINSSGAVTKLPIESFWFMLLILNIIVWRLEVRTLKKSLYLS